MHTVLVIGVNQRVEEAELVVIGIPRGPDDFVKKVIKADRPHDMVVVQTWPLQNRG